MLALALVVLPRFELTERWSYALPSRSIVAGGGTVDVMDGRVFFHEPSGMNGSGVGCLDPKTGRRLWYDDRPGQEVEEMIVGHGHVLVRQEAALVELSPQDGRAQWRVPVEPSRLGPFLDGHTVVAEVKAGALRAYDLRTHRLRWSLDYPTEFRSSSRTNAAAVANGALWTNDAHGAVLKISLKDGKILLKRPFDGGRLDDIVPLGDRIVLVGEKGAVAWRGADGKPLWRSATLPRGSARPVAQGREFWVAPPFEGALYRYRAADGRPVGAAIPLDEWSGFRSAPVPYRGGYVLAGHDGLLRLGADGRPLGFYRAGEPLTQTAVLGDDLLVWSSDRIVRLAPGTPPPPKDPVGRARSLVAKADLSVSDRIALERLGRAALPTIVEALKAPRGKDESALKFVLMRVAQAPDTPLVFPLADAARTFTDQSTIENRDYRDWMEREADPEWLVPRLLPRLRAAPDAGTQVRLVGYLVRSRSPEVAAELLGRLRNPETAMATKEAIYHGLGASGAPEALAEIVRLRGAGPEPKWEGATPPAPMTETERVLAAVFDARMRFYRPKVESFNLAYGPGVRPFAVVGWPSGLRPTPNPPYSGPWPSARLPMPYIAFEPLDANGTMVRFDRNGTEATARIGVMVASLYGAGYEARLRKTRGEWIVTSMRMIWIS